MRVLERYAGDLVAGAATNPIGAVRASQAGPECSLPRRSCPGVPDADQRRRCLPGRDLSHQDRRSFACWPRICRQLGWPGSSTFRRRTCCDAAGRATHRPGGAARGTCSRPRRRYLVAANPAPPDACSRWPLVHSAGPGRGLARVKSISEDAAFTRAVLEAYAMAARATGDTDSAEAWEVRLERYFQMVLDA